MRLSLFLGAKPLPPPSQSWFATDSDWLEAYVAFYFFRGQCGLDRDVYIHEVFYFIHSDYVEMKMLASLLPSLLPRSAYSMTCFGTRLVAFVHKWP
jgi:hypothetical protein